MDQAARVAFIQAQTVCALAEIEAMKATNGDCLSEGFPLTYTAEDFRDVGERFLIGYNQVIEYLTEHL